MLPLFVMILGTMITKNTTAVTSESYTATPDFSQLGLLLWQSAISYRSKPRGPEIRTGAM